MSTIAEQAAEMARSGATREEVAAFLQKHGQGSGELSWRVANDEAQRIVDGQSMRRPTQYTSANATAKENPPRLLGDPRKAAAEKTGSDAASENPDLNRRYLGASGTQIPVVPKDGGAKGPAVRERGTTEYRAGEISPEDEMQMRAREMFPDAMLLQGMRMLMEERGIDPATARELEEVGKIAGPEPLKALMNEKLPQLENDWRSLDAQMEDVMAREVDPTRIFANGAGISAAIAVAAGQLAAGVVPNGGPNVALAIIQNAQRMDVEAQIQEAANARAAGNIRSAILQGARATLGDELDAMKYAQSVQSSIIAGEVAKHAASVDKAEGFRKLSETGKKLNEQALENRKASKSGFFSRTAKDYTNEFFQKRIPQMNTEAQMLERNVMSGQQGVQFQGQPSAGGQRPVQVRNPTPADVGGGTNFSSDVSRDDLISPAAQAALGDPMGAAVKTMGRAGAAEAERRRQPEAMEADARNGMYNPDQLFSSPSEWIDDIKARGTQFAPVTDQAALWAAEYETRNPGFYVNNPNVAVDRVESEDLKEAQKEHAALMSATQKFSQVRDLASGILKYMEKSGDGWKITSEGVRKFLDATGMSDKEFSQKVSVFRDSATAIITSPLVPKSEKANIARGSDKDLGIFLNQVAGAIGKNDTVTTDKDLRSYMESTDFIMSDANRRIQNVFHMSGITAPGLYGLTSAQKTAAAAKDKKTSGGE